jgi:hypothetical protein
MATESQRDDDDAAQKLEFAGKSWERAHGAERTTLAPPADREPIKREPSDSCERYILERGDAA